MPGPERVPTTLGVDLGPLVSIRRNTVRWTVLRKSAGWVFSPACVHVVNLKNLYRAEIKVQERKNQQTIPNEPPTPHPALACNMP